MRRYTGQKPLYEAIAKTKGKSQRRSILDLLHPGNSRVEQGESGSAQTVPEEAKPVAETKPPVEAVKPRVETVKPRVEPVRPPESKPAPQKPVEAVEMPVKTTEQGDPRPRPVQSWLRPKPVQFHDGRFEASLPYTIGVTIILAAVLLVLGAFRLGQRWSAAPASPVTPPAGKTSPAAVTRDVPTPRAEPPAPATNSSRETVAPAAAAQGDHVIVLAQYARYEDLAPVQEYFKQNGMATEILAVPKLREYLVSHGINAGGLEDSSGFILVTADYYANPQNPGTDGYTARMKIIDLGRGYKAPPGMESFAPKYFSDAYGRKVR